MRRVQEIAVPRFAADGFDAVTVDQIAELADVAPVSVYRWFGTKEGIVLWDEYDPPMLDEIARRLEHEDPFDAICHALVELLAEVYDRDRALVLARSRLVYREPALLSAALLQSLGFQRAIAELLSERLDPFEADVVAAAAVGALTVSVDRWQRDAAAEPLATIIERAFAALSGASS